MKKLVLLVFVLVGLSFSGGFADMPMPFRTGIDWSPTIDLYGNGVAGSGYFGIGYDENRKTSCIWVLYSPYELWSFENENPKLYNDIKNTIQTHLTGKGRLQFGYKLIGGLNIIQVVQLKNFTN